MVNTEHERREGSGLPLRSLGFWAMLTGALALMLVFVQITAPMLEPAPSVGAQIGEIAGEIKRSAWRLLLGQPTPPEEVEGAPWWMPLAVIAPVLGVLALVLSAIAAARGEPRRFPAYAAGFGVSAIVFQIAWWMLLVILAMMLLVAIIENMGDIFSA